MSFLIMANQLQRMAGKDKAEVFLSCSQFPHFYTELYQSTKYRFWAIYRRLGYMQEVEEMTRLVRNLDSWNVGRIMGGSVMENHETY